MKIVSRLTFAAIWCFSGSHAFSQTIIIDSIVTRTAEICAGDSLSVYFQASGYQNGNNALFNAELSNANGDFTSVTIIGSVTGASNTLIRCFMPYSVAAGSLYRIRVSSKNPKVTGPQNGNDLTVRNTPITITAGGATVFDYGQSVTLSTSFNSGDAYQWIMNNEEIDGASSTTFTAQLSGDYQLRAEDSYTCIRQSNAIGVTATTVFSSNARPNVVLFITDDNSFDSWSPNGGPAFFSDPNVSALAEEGANFSTAYAVFSFCVPSRATMLTGLYPHLNGATCNNECNFKQTLPTVATILHDGGYYTAQVGKYHLTSEPQIGYDFWMASEKFKYENNTYNYNGTPKLIPGHLTDVITDTAVALIGRIDQPLFLLVEHFAPHIMYDVQDRFDTLYAHAPIDLPVAFDSFQCNYPSFIPENIFLGTADSARLVEDMRDVYELLAGVDESVGRIRDALIEAGKYDSTLFIFISDNGYLHDQHLLGGKVLAYEESIRIPLFVRYPEWFEPNTVVKNEMALNLDVAPTILDALNIVGDYGFQGLSLHDLATGAVHRNEFFYEAIQDASDDEQIPSLRAVRTNEYKYIRYSCNSTTEEFFDEVKDPYERNNLINDPNYASLIQAFREKLDSLRMVYNDLGDFYADAGDCYLAEPKIGPVFDLAVTVANASCSASDGNLTANPSGGAPPYTYEWSTGGTGKKISGLAAGKYWVRVTDANGVQQKVFAEVPSVNKISAVVNPSDTTLCLGTQAVLDGTMRKEKTFTKVVKKTIPDNKPAGVSSIINVATLPMTGNVNVAAITVDITHPYLSDLAITLTAPNGMAYNLAVNVGGAGDDYRMTRFADDAAVSIADTVPPYIGTYRPQTELASIPASNGAWKLKVVDSGEEDAGRLLSWSISFYVPQSASNFSWNPTTDLTNYTSLHPIASPQVTTTYTLTTSDPNCTSTATAAVNIIDCKLMFADAASSEAHIYPNPGDTEIRIELMTESADEASILLTVTNLEGKNLIQKNVMSRNGKAEAVIDVSELASGSYLLVVDGSGQAIPFVVSH